MPPLRGIRLFGPGLPDELARCVEYCPGMSDEEGACDPAEAAADLCFEDREVDAGRTVLMVALAVVVAVPVILLGIHAARPKEEQN